MTARIVSLVALPVIVLTLILRMVYVQVKILQLRAK